MFLFQWTLPPQIPLHSSLPPTLIHTLPLSWTTWKLTPWIARFWCLIWLVPVSMFDFSFPISDMCSITNITQWPQCNSEYIQNIKSHRSVRRFSVSSWGTLVCQGGFICVSVCLFTKLHSRIKIQLSHCHSLPPYWQQKASQQQLVWVQL